jgi:hypothetical protein
MLLSGMSRAPAGRRRIQDLVFLVVGVSTPIGILAVNASAFIMLHLQAFRLGIAICALVSGLSLNALGAYAALARAYSYAPRLYTEYRYWLVGIAVVVVAAWSVVGAWLTYLSMQNPKHLPNLAAVLTALWLLFLPFAVTFISRRFKLLDHEPGLFRQEPRGDGRNKRQSPAPPPP